MVQIFRGDRKQKMKKKKGTVSWASTIKHPAVQTEGTSVYVVGRKGGDK